MSSNFFINFGTMKYHYYHWKNTYVVHVCSHLLDFKKKKLELK